MSLQYVDLTPDPETPLNTEATTRFRTLPKKVECPECPIEVCETCCPAEMGAPHFFAEGDKIYLQFFFEDTFNADPENPTYGWAETGDNPGDFWLQLVIYAPDGTLISSVLEDLAQAWASWHDGTQSVQNLILDTSLPGFVGVDCFYYCVRLLGPSFVEYQTVVLVTGALPDPANFEQGDTILVGDILYVLTGRSWISQGPVGSGDLIYESSTGSWYQSDGSTVDKIDRPELVDNPSVGLGQCCGGIYRKIRCEQTVEICTARTTGKDCQGRVFDRPTNGDQGGIGSSAFRYCRRFPGSIEPTAYPVQREITEDGVLIQGGYSERARLRTAGICRYDAEDIAAVLASEGFTIDGEPWDTITDVERNNENGLLWYLDITLGREICQATKDCNFDFD